jgi:hypothetical protein
MSQPVDPLEIQARFHANRENNSKEFQKTLDDIFDILTFSIPEPEVEPIPEPEVQPILEPSLDECSLFIEYPSLHYPEPKRFQGASSN